MTIQMENIIPLMMASILMSPTYPALVSVLLTMMNENIAVMKGDINKNHIRGSLINCLPLLINTPLNWPKKVG